MLQELGGVRKERDQALQQCEDDRAEIRRRDEEVEGMRESGRALEEQHAAERAEADAAAASLMEVRNISWLSLLGLKYVEWFCWTLK